MSGVAGSDERPVGPGGRELLHAPDGVDQVG